MSLYIGKVNNLHNKIHYTNTSVPESLLSTADIVEGTTFNSRLGVFTVSNIITDHSQEYQGQHYIPSGTTTFDSLFLSSGGYVIQLYIINGIYYTKDELREAGYLLTMRGIFLSPDYVVAVGFREYIKFSCVNIVLTRYLFPEGPIEVSNGVVKIGGVNIRDKQLLLFNKINNTDNYYSTVNSQLQILNSSNNAYPKTILKNNGIFVSDGVTEEPIILANGFMPLGVLDKNTLYPDSSNKGKVTLPSSSARFVYITLYLSIGRMIDQDYVLPNNTNLPFSFLMDKQTIQYSNIFSHIETNSWQISYNIGVKSYGNDIELTYQQDMTSFTACTTVWKNVGITDFPPPTVTEVRAMPNCQGLHIADQYFPENISDGSGGTIPFFKIVSCDYQYIL